MIIQGRVIDKETGIAIPWIAVKLDNLTTPKKENIRDFTDPEGLFFLNVEKGPYQLEVRSPVHTPYTERIFRDTTLTIRLAKITF